MESAMASLQPLLQSTAASLQASLQAYLLSPTPPFTILELLTRSTPTVQFTVSFVRCLQTSLVLKKAEEEKAKKGEKRSEWFFVFVNILLISYGGGLLMPIMLGQPSNFIMTSDKLILPALLAYFLIFHILPKILIDLIFRNRLSTIVITFLAQVARSSGIVSFVDKTLSMSPTKISPLYPYLPALFPPIIAGTLAGNMSSIFLKGLNKHIESGMPWAVENGLLFSSFYLFYVHDVTGPIGTSLRNFMQTSLPLGYYLIDNLGGKGGTKVFATCMVSLCMGVIGVLQLDMFYGAAFKPTRTLGGVLSGFGLLNIGGGEKSDSGVVVNAKASDDEESKKEEVKPKLIPTQAPAQTQKGKNDSEVTTRSDKKQKGKQ